MEKTASIKSIGVKYGLILGVVAIALFLIGVATDNPEFGGMWLMLLVLVIGIVLAHREYKSEGDGFLEYGEGLGLGTLVAAVFAVIFTIFNYIYIKFIDPAYMDMIRQLQMEQIQEQGLTEEQMDMAMDWVMTLTTPEMVLVFNILGTIFFGFILSLIISAFTKNRNPELSV